MHRTGRHAKEILSQRFGKLLVIERSGSDSRNALWLCRCDCGAEIITTGAQLRRGAKKSCGRLPNARNNLRHGESGTVLHNKWMSMRKRCSNPNDSSWVRYGARGIRVCAEWESSYESFRDWSHANNYRPDLEIDRIDNDGPYEPDNCRYVTTSVNRGRTRRTHKHVFYGERMSMAEAARRSGVPRSEIGKRLKRGYTPEDAVRPQPRNPNLSRPRPVPMPPSIARPTPSSFKPSKTG